MKHELKKTFYNKLPHDKIKINWNKNPISMSLFLSFLTVEVKRSHDHLGSYTGWTLLENDKLKLKIGGGIVNGIELLDSLQFGEKLSNSYNNYINPFYLFDILSEEGRDFFFNYYKSDIENIVKSVESDIKYLESDLKNKKELLSEILSEVKILSKL